MLKFIGTLFLSMILISGLTLTFSVEDNTNQGIKAEVNAPAEEGKKMDCCSMDKKAEAKEKSCCSPASKAKTTTL